MGLCASTGLGPNSDNPGLRLSSAGVHPTYGGGWQGRAASEVVRLAQARGHADSVGDGIAGRYIYLALGWGVAIVVVGSGASLQFIWPELWQGIPAMSFGRLRPVHSQGILYGWLSLVMVPALRHPPCRGPLGPRVRDHPV